MKNEQPLIDNELGDYYWVDEIEEISDEEEDW